MLFFHRTGSAVSLFMSVSPRTGDALAMYDAMMATSLGNSFSAPLYSLVLAVAVTDSVLLSSLGC